ncbi:ribbon-helix-helix protein, CopG family [Agromyces laixinhei]|uniref:ribbon-helix-helix protein, CopG family n=1 Tax=Agromyces laixinhei TaxID=2585717 RepID=UPI00143D689B|nr:ribbon-helix-helix protein, CopG family [Agromyces laixinhei]
MATLDRRVQVLFEPEQYAALEAEAAAAHMSVGALIREAVDERLARRRRDARAALDALWARADEQPARGPIDWAAEKESMERPFLREIP